MADSGDHAAHDPQRVAEAVDRGARRAPLLDLCGRCESLYLDLLALTAALPLATLPSRPRAYTLTAADARRLHGHRWRRWWSAIGSARDAFTRPLAIGFTTLGIAGLLLTVAPAVIPGMGGAAGAAPLAEGTVDILGAPAAEDPGPSTVRGGFGGEAAVPMRDTGPSSTLLLSVGLLGVGGGLFAIRRMAARGRPVR